MINQVDLTEANIDIKAILKGKQAAVARAVNLVENQRADHEGVIKRLLETLGEKARQDRHIIGISGPPGVGKSSIISKLIQKYRADGKRIGVISVDPSSIKTGGALLGDRIRIEYDPKDQDIFIRSMSAGKSLGGLAYHTGRILTIFEAAFDVILLETVGVGQSESDIKNAADTVVVLVQPGSGDMLQFIKAGIMEIPHILVVNKADQKKRSARTFYDLKNAISLETINGPGCSNGKGCNDDGDGKDCSYGPNCSYGTGWQTKLVMTSAVKNFGIGKLKELMESHLDFLNGTNIDKIRREKSHVQAFMTFKEQFGNHGIKALGGQEQILFLLEEAGVTNSYTGAVLLFRQIYKIMNISAR